MASRVSVQVMMEVFQVLDNNPLLGHSRVKMALDSLGCEYEWNRKLWSCITPL
jgi:hypothetical protein